MSRLIRDPATRGVLANSVSLVATILFQLLSLPVLVGAIGVQAYGYWLLVTAAPTYLSLLDLGLGTAAGTRATQLVALGREKEAGETISRAWTWTIGTVLVLLVIALGTLGGLVTGQRVAATAASDLVLVTLAAVVWLNVPFVDGALRAQGLLASSQMFLSAIRLIEFGAITWAAHQFHSVTWMLGAFLGSRVCCLVAYYWMATHRVVWFHLRIERDLKKCWLRTRYLVKPSLAYLGFPMGTAIANQVPLFLVSSSFGSHAVVVLSAARTIGNTILQITNVATNGIRTEFTRDLTSGRIGRSKRLLSYSLAGSAGVSGAVSLYIGVWGSDVLKIWLGDEVHIPGTLLFLFMSLTISDIPWRVMASPIMALNQHARLSATYVLAVMGATIFQHFELPRLGIVAVPISFILVAVLMTPVALSQWHGVAHRVVQAATNH